MVDHETRQQEPSRVGAHLVDTSGLPGKRHGACDMIEHAGGAPNPATLQALLREAATELRGSPKTEKLHRALAATYLEPAATQELAADRLGLPFTTYRYQLVAAINRVTERLWQRELHADIP